MQGGTWRSEYRVFESHWMWRRQPQCRHPCSQKPTSRPPAGQAGYTAPQCGQVHHMLGPRYCRDTWPRLALASNRRGKGETRGDPSSFLLPHKPYKIWGEIHAFTYLVQCWQTVSMVIENAVEWSIHSIVDIVHQRPVTDYFIFLCGVRGKSFSWAMLKLKFRLQIKHLRKN